MEKNQSVTHLTIRDIDDVNHHARKIFDRMAFLKENASNASFECLRFETLLEHVGASRVKGDFANISERIFFDLCWAKGCKIAKVPEDATSKTPDFKVVWGGSTFFAEVKQFEQNADGRAIEYATMQGYPHVRRVDFTHSGGLVRTLAKQAAQLSASCADGAPTLGVIYSDRLFGATDYQVEHALKNGTCTVPVEISAVLLLSNVNLYGKILGHNLYPNVNAKVPFPVGLFGV